MPSSESNRYVILTCNRSRNLGERIQQETKALCALHEMGVADTFPATTFPGLVQAETVHFSDHEFEPTILSTVRDRTVFLVHYAEMPSDNLMEMLLLIDACKRNSASKVVVVMPYFPFSRQDRKDQNRRAIGAKVVANMITAAGGDAVICLDLHAMQTGGFFDIPVDVIEGHTLFTPEVSGWDLPNLTFCSPDMGGTKRVKTFADLFPDAETVVMDKTRAKPNEVSKLILIGDVTGKNVVIIDDMMDTAGTVCKAAGLLMERGALSVRVITTHPLLSGKAQENIANSVITEVLVANTIPREHGYDTPKIREIDIAPALAEVILRAMNSESVTQFNTNRN